MPRPVDFRQDGVVRTVVAPIQHGRAPKGIEQIEGRKRINAIALHHPTPAGLEDVVQQPAYPLGPEGHAGLPIAAPAVERNIE